MEKNITTFEHVEDDSKKCQEKILDKIFGIVYPTKGDSDGRNIGADTAI
jgi:hypothetical protein